MLTAVSSNALTVTRANVLSVPLNSAIQLLYYSLLFPAASRKELDRAVHFPDFKRGGCFGWAEQSLSCMPCCTCHAIQNGILPSGGQWLLVMILPVSFLILRNQSYKTGFTCCPVSPLYCYPWFVTVPGVHMTSVVLVWSPSGCSVFPGCLSAWLLRLG